MKKVNQKKILISILIIAIVIIAIILGRNVLKKENEETNETNTTTSEGNFETEIDMSDLANSEIREDGMKINTSNKIAQGIEFNDMQITDITIESSGDMASFNAKVENNLGKDIEGYIIYITFLRKDGSVIDKLETFFPDIPDGETGFITATIPKDIATAYEIQMERQIQ